MIKGAEWGISSLYRLRLDLVVTQGGNEERTGWQLEHKKQTYVPVIQTKKRKGMYNK